MLDNTKTIDNAPLCAACAVTLRNSYFTVSAPDPLDEYEAAECGYCESAPAIGRYKLRLRCCALTV